MLKFKYKVVRVSRDDQWASDGSTGAAKKLFERNAVYHPAELLNALGQDGWKLTVVASGSDSESYRLFLERQMDQPCDVVPRSFFRLIRRPTPRLRDFMSYAARGRPCPDPRVERERLGISVRDSEISASVPSRASPYLGSFAAEIVVEDHSPIEYEKRHSVPATSRSGEIQRFCSPASSE